MPAGGEERQGVSLWSIAREAMDVACAASDATVHEMMAKGRSRAEVAYARQIAMYLAHVVGQMTMGEISRMFRRDRSTVAHACHMVEERRENLKFDAAIEKVEAEYRKRLRWLSENSRGAAAFPRRQQRRWKHAERDGLSSRRRRFR